MKYGYILLTGLFFACSGELETEEASNAGPTEQELRSSAKELAEKALDLTGAGISEIPPMEIGEIDELPESLDQSYVAEYLEEQGFTLIEVDEDIVPPNESKWVSFTLSNDEVECEVSKFYKNTDDQIIVTEGVHCSLLDE